MTVHDLLTKMKELFGGEIQIMANSGTSQVEIEVEMSSEKEMSTFENQRLTNCFANSVLQLMFVALKDYVALEEDSSTFQAHLKKILNEMKRGEKLISTDNLIKALGWTFRHHCAAEFFDELMAKMSDNIQSSFSILTMEGQMTTSILLSTCHRSLQEGLKFYRKVLSLSRML
jgi:hypothetical protein